MNLNRDAAIDRLYRVSKKAEIVNGEIICMPPTGDAPGYASLEIVVSLREYARQTGRGRAVGDNVGFIVNLPHRWSFCPDAAYHVGRGAGMKFFDGAPIFAVEVRSESDHGAAAERRLAAKRSDYFAAGTEVVWDVDLLSENVVRAYRCNEPERPTIYHRGEIAAAEPAVPGWSISVDNLFLD
jgi:Uma2 family endonuclease